MGFIIVKATVKNLSKTENFFEDSFLVDTGSLDCMASGKKLEEIGIEIEGSKTYELASGEPVEYNYGFARINFLGTETVTHIIFGPDHIEPILGVLALEGANMIIDPVTNEIIKLKAVSLK